MKRHPSNVRVVTQDLQLVHVVASASSEAGWCQTFSAALSGIDSPRLDVLVLDGDLCGALGPALATYFCDRRPGRRAVVVGGSRPAGALDGRVTWLDEATPGALDGVLGGDEPAALPDFVPLADALATPAAA